MTPITHITPREQALQRENERLTKALQISAFTVETQAERIVELEADAARYQFIREGSFSGSWYYTEVPGNWSKGMDATIDKAMAAMKETK